VHVGRQRVVVGQQEMERAQQVQRVVVVGHLPQQRHRRRLGGGGGRGGGRGAGLRIRLRRDGGGGGGAEGDGRGQGRGEHGRTRPVPCRGHEGPWWCISCPMPRVPAWHRPVRPRSPR